EGRYRILEKLGEGGMATVYLADDVRHERRVAVKVLKPELAAVVGADRFLAEIKTTANLQHPHILPLFDSGEADGFLFYVMPYVEGETLRDRLDREKQLPVEEALGIATSVASALQVAHEAGIVHRDIKPGNVLLSRGEPLVADFGIALAVGSAGGSRLTETGLSVGTPYYMSPEQATGDQSIGPASDIYALACVLYEMLVGEPPYSGSTAQAVLGKIIQGAPVSATAVRSSIPANVDAALRRALEKLPADRFRDARGFAAALADPGFRYGHDPRAGAADAGGARAWRRRTVAAAGAAVLFAGLAALAQFGDEEPGRVARFGVALPDGHDPGLPYGANVALSPDGGRLVYVGPMAGGGQQLWLRALDQLAPRPINGTEGALSPAFSPDGARVAFLTTAPTTLKVVSLGGEPPLTLATDGLGGNSVAWGPDGRIYVDGAALSIGWIPETGGEVTLLTQLDSATAELFHGWYDVLPNSRGILFTVGRTPASAAGLYTIAVADVETGAHRTLVQGVYARYAPSGHLVYATAEGALLAAPFDPDRLELTGAPVALAEGVGVGSFGSADLTLSRDGTLVYLAGGVASGLARAVWVDRAGGVTPVDPDWEFDPGEPEVGVALSPDDRRLAVKVSTEAGEDIWIKELDDGPLSRLTFHEALDRRPRWSADGRRVFYTSDREGPDNHYDIWSQPADGTGSPERLLDLEASITEAVRAADDRGWILRLGGLANQTGVRDLVALADGAEAPTPIAAEPYDEKAVDLSPDGRWVAYESTETGRDEIYVRPYPDADGGKWQVSTQGGINPRWGRTGRELFYVDGAGNMVAVAVDAVGGTFRSGRRETLFSVAERSLHALPNYTTWDVAADDERFLMVQVGTAGDGASTLVVVQNFFRELRERVGR
ncbi:MAG: protein kinase, partial [Longimicrobiales bacterium]|nr:protein kinase [Longimicrobiales bacterium]